MIKKLVSTFFTILFMVIITVPSIISVIDDSIDVSVFYDLSEEEDEIESEHVKTLELFSEVKNEPICFLETTEIEYLGLDFRNYPKPYLNLISPPPEL
ncbi:hypothetical protein [Pontimicrobium sp. MEBiC01747]